MLITICSDIHDNIWKLADALPGMNDGDLLIFDTMTQVVTVRSV